MYVEIRRKHLKENPTLTTMKGLKLKLKWAPKGKGIKKPDGKGPDDKKLMAMLTMEQVSTIIGEDVTKSTEFLELLRDNELDTGDMSGLFMLGEHEPPGNGDDDGTDAKELILSFKDQPTTVAQEESKEAKETRLVGAALAAGRSELLAEQARATALEDELQRIKQRLAATERASQYGNSGPPLAGAPVAKTPLSAAMARFGVGSLPKQPPSATNPSLVSGAQRISPLDKINSLPIDGGGHGVCQRRCQRWL